MGDGTSFPHHCGILRHMAVAVRCCFSWLKASTYCDLLSCF